MKVSVRTIDNPFLDYTVNLRRRLNVVVRVVAFRVERGWKMGVPVDTGAYRASIHTITADGLTKSGASAGARAQKKRPGVVIRNLGVGKSAFIEAFVVAGVSYARVVNAVHPTKPFAMEKAVQAERRFFRNEVGKAFRASGGPRGL